MQVRFFGAMVNRQIQGDLRKNLTLAAIHLRNAVKVALNRSQPYRISRGPKGRWYKGLDPSRPGESPKKIRGDLQRSIAYEVTPNGQQAFVGTGLAYGKFLELGTRFILPRPFLRGTLAKESPAILKIIATGTK